MATADERMAQHLAKIAVHLGDIRTIMKTMNENFVTFVEALKDVDENTTTISSEEVSTQLTLGEDDLDHNGRKEGT